MEATTEIREQLSRLIGECMNVLRGHVEYAAYPKYIFGMVFLKVLHDFREPSEQQTGWYLDNTFQWEMLLEGHDHQAFSAHLARLASAAPAEIGALITAIDLDKFSESIGHDMFELAHILGGFNLSEAPRNLIVEVLTKYI